MILKSTPELRRSACARGGRGRAAGDPARPAGACARRHRRASLLAGRLHQRVRRVPCYVARGRWDDGVYLSVEHSSSYAGFEEGLYIVVLASGSPRDRAIGAALRRAKGQYPDVVVKTAPVYLGCIH